MEANIYLYFVIERSLPRSRDVIRVDAIIQKSRLLGSTTKCCLPRGHRVQVIEQKILLHARTSQSIISVDIPFVNDVILMRNDNLRMSVQECPHKAVRAAWVSNEHKECFNSIVKFKKLSSGVRKTSRNAYGVR